jgi:hypothetical protein
MALLDDEELLPFFGNPNIQRQGARARALAAQRDVNTLPDPRTYAAVSGLLGTAPDQMGFSVMNPQYESIMQTARPAFATGTALGVAPLAKVFQAPAMALGRAGERVAERVVPQIMQRGGLPAELLQGMAQGSRSNVLPPKRFQGPRLEGMPEAVDVGGRMEQFGTDQRIVDIAKQYMADKGITYSPQKPYAEVDVKRAEKIAKEYAAMRHDPNDPKTKKAYKALAKETQDQYEQLLKAGYKFDFIRGADPYGNPRNAINDLVMNKRMSVFPTESGFGSSAADISGNPLLARSDLRIANDPNTTYNDLFRAVHDVFGHAKYGVGFRARGEENAFQSHARMYSPEALPAAASETRGQNSWVNYGPFGERNRIASPADTIYADQKTGLMPAYTYQEGLLTDWAWPQGIYKP